MSSLKSPGAPDAARRRPGEGPEKRGLSEWHSSQAMMAWRPVSGKAAPRRASGPKLALLQEVVARAIAARPEPAGVDVAVAGGAGPRQRLPESSRGCGLAATGQREARRIAALRRDLPPTRRRMHRRRSGFAAVPVGRARVSGRSPAAALVAAAGVVPGRTGRSGRPGWARGQGRGGDEREQAHGTELVVVDVAGLALRRQRLVPAHLDPPGRTVTLAWHFSQASGEVLALQLEAAVLDVVEPPFSFHDPACTGRSRSPPTFYRKMKHNRGNDHDKPDTAHQTERFCLCPGCPGDTVFAACASGLYRSEAGVPGGAGDRGAWAERGGALHRRRSRRSCPRGVRFSRGWRADAVADGGRTWVLGSAPQPPPTITALVISPDYAEDGVLLARWNGILRSADGGWRGTGSVGPVHLQPGHLADFREDETLFAGRRRGAFRSTNGGRAAKVDLPVGFETVLSLAVSPRLQAGPHPVRGDRVRGAAALPPEWRRAAGGGRGPFRRPVNAVSLAAGAAGGLQRAAVHANSAAWPRGATAGQAGRPSWRS